MSDVFNGEPPLGVSYVPTISTSNLEAAGESSVPTSISNSQTSAAEGGERGYHDEFVRLQSYPHQWNKDVSKRELAREGFYYTPEGLKCFCCGMLIGLDAISTDEVALHRERLVGEPHRGANLRNIPIGDASDFRYERNRLISFLGANWFPVNVDPEDLAKWGFYWTGVADVGRCNFCRLEVRGWEPNDRGLSEHMRWNPHCPFMQNRAVGNVRLGEEANAHNVQDDTAVTAHHGLMNTAVNVEDLGVMLTAPPRHPEYASQSSRFGSYSMWPLSMRQRPEQLAEAGFYYTSNGDRVICFHCGGGLKDWGQTDLPWVEHAVWFPRCAYLLIKKGREFVSQVQALKDAQAAVMNVSSGQLQQAMSTRCTNISASTHEQIAEAPTVASDSFDSNDIATAEASLEPAEEVHSRRMCKVCYVKELGIVFLPCGHMATCPDCAPQLTSCPICRSKANAYVRAFLP